MAIDVTCPNGHRLHVKSRFAGMAGLCPHCRARVQVPRSEQQLEREAMAVLGPAKAYRPLPGTPERAAHQTPQRNDTWEQSRGKGAGSTLRLRKKVCPDCGQTTSATFTSCPRCGATLANSTAALPGG
jgi:hypothetical protein